MAAAASSSTSAEAQKELLLAVEWRLESWRADVPLGEFEGVTVGDDGLVTGLNFGGKSDVAFKLADFAQLVSLKEINLNGCWKAAGGCVVRGRSGGRRLGGQSE